jgi:hypothetical protein
MTTAESLVKTEKPGANYLTCECGVWNWLRTTDHKRIAILYLYAILLFFILAAFAAALMRIDLLTPQGDLLLSTDYNKMFHARRAHGLVFPDPVDPQRAGQFFGAFDDRRARSCLP